MTISLFPHQIRLPQTTPGKTLPAESLNRIGDFIRRERERGAGLHHVRITSQPRHYDDNRWNPAQSEVFWCNAEGHQLPWRDVYAMEGVHAFEASLKPLKGAMNRRANDANDPGYKSELLAGENWVSLQLVVGNNGRKPVILWNANRNEPRRPLGMDEQIATAAETLKVGETGFLLIEDDSPFSGFGSASSLAAGHALIMEFPEQMESWRRTIAEQSSEFWGRTSKDILVSRLADGSLLVHSLSGQEAPYFRPYAVVAVLSLAASAAHPPLPRSILPLFATQAA